MSEIMGPPKPKKKSFFARLDGERFRNAKGRFVSEARKTGAAARREGEILGRGARSGVRRARESESGRSFGIAGRAIGRHARYKIAEEPVMRFERRAKKRLGKRFLKTLKEEERRTPRNKKLTPAEATELKRLLQKISR